MANEAKWVYTGVTTLESNGISAANAAFMPATDAAFTSAAHSGYVYADFALMVSGFASSLATTGSLGLALWRRDINIDGTLDEGVPSANLKAHFAGYFTMPLSGASAAIYNAAVRDVPIYEDQEYYLENLTGQSVAAGWTLKVKAKTFVPGA